jgi:hypothetical protein
MHAILIRKLATLDSEIIYIGLGIILRNEVLRQWDIQRYFAPDSGKVNIAQYF